jgi:hypothetical protein
VVVKALVWQRAVLDNLSLQVDEKTRRSMQTEQKREETKRNGSFAQKLWLKKKEEPFASPPNL